MSQHQGKIEPEPNAWKHQTDEKAKEQIELERFRADVSNND